MAPSSDCEPFDDNSLVILSEKDAHNRTTVLPFDDTHKLIGQF